MDLPIEPVLPLVLEALARHGAAVVRAPPGAGKTTRVPVALLDSGLVGADQRVLLLQPRRVAARAAARRIAAERGGRVGEEVGYQIRFEDRTSPRTRLAILTEGLLTRKLQDDPLLSGVGAVVLDEFHERSIHVDLGLAFLAEVHRTVRRDLRLVVMSATMDTGPVARFLDGAPVIEVEGRTHPLAVRWLERPDDRPPPVRVAAAVRRALDPALGDDGGDVLVFLPGAAEIRRSAEELEAALPMGIDVVPLHGSLPGPDQDRAIAPGPRRKVVLATNIAETSLTIEGVTTVVDSGLVKVLRHDPSRGLDRLDLTRVSRASADQRAGRAGRTGPGRVFRLWTRDEDARLHPAEPPEVARVDLAPAILEVLGWCGRDPRAFEWFEPPPPAHVQRALDLLRRLGAVERDGFRLTGRGRTLRAFPVHPRLAATLVEAHAWGAPAAGALVAAIASERDPMVRPADPDVLGRLDVVRRPLSAGRGPSRTVDTEAIAAVRRAAHQLEAIAVRVLGPAPPARCLEAEAVGRALLSGFPDRVGRRRAESPDRVVLVGGRGARIAASSALGSASLLVAVEVQDGAGAESVVSIAGAIERDWLEADPRRVELAPVVRWNERREAAEAVIEECYLDLVIDHRPDTGADPAELARVLAREAARDPARALALDGPAAGLLARIDFLRRACPPPAGPALPEALGPDLPALLERICAGRRTFAQLRRADLVGAVRDLVGPRGIALLDRLAPERLPVPSGSLVRLRYDPGGGPVLAIRLQEVFGMAVTPRVAGGRVPVTMELLGPHMRPVQVTQDLASFWQTTYAQVRKDLRARYPKHSWPEDPLGAAPEKRPRRRRG